MRPQVGFHVREVPVLEQYALEEFIRNKGYFEKAFKQWRRQRKMKEWNYTDEIIWKNYKTKFKAV